MKVGGGLQEKGSANGQWWLDNIGAVIGEGKDFERLASRQLAGLLLGVWWVLPTLVGSGQYYSVKKISAASIMLDPKHLKIKVDFAFLFIYSFSSISALESSLVVHSSLSSC
jgi:hypothetical protein